LIGLFLAGYVWFSFWLFLKGMQFIAGFPGLGDVLVERLLFLLFAFLFVLLLFSNLVIAYTNLFKNKETAWLLSLPVPEDTIFQWKFMEATVLASWAFLFLIAPLLVAYGVTCHAAWHFYLVTPVLILIFISLPAAGGAWGAVCLGRYLDRRSFQVTAFFALILLFVLASKALQPAPVTDTLLETRVIEVLDRLLANTQFAQFPWLPSYWLSAVILSWSEGAMATAGFFFLVLLSYALLFGYMTMTSMGRHFYEANSAVQSRQTVWGRWRFRRAQKTGAVLHRLNHGWLDNIHIPGVGSDVRALAVKDIRMFWRDTSQWGQTLVLFGLLGVYIMNLRHFTQQLSNPFWVNLVLHLNLMACSLNLATLTTRFVYPQFSQEGKRLWIVGMAPMGLSKVIKTKFSLAFMATLILTAGLTILSCSMLQTPLIRHLYFLVAVGVMTFSLNGLAMGLGVLYPNMKEENPGKIVSGFGGTFCLILSFLYIAGSVAVLAWSSPWGRLAFRSPLSSAAGIVLFLAWSWLIGWIPLRQGLRRAAAFE
jgi:ABC-2 type transport system permease protein